jgi:hypothetical protein
MERRKPLRCVLFFEKWWARQDLNLGPTDYESAALTAELRARRKTNQIDSILMNKAERGNSFVQKKPPYAYLTTLSVK